MNPQQETAQPQPPRAKMADIPQHRRRLLDVYVGLRVGRLRVVAMAGIRKPDGAFIVECDCGHRRKVAKSYLRARAHSTCGHECPLGHQAVVHGQARHGATTRSYETWGAMLDRCYNKNHVHYDRYGGRGITVCKRWLKFENFFEDMGSRPTGLTLDRWPNMDGNYEKSNCRWANKKEQSDNRSSTRFVTLRGEKMCMSDAASELGLATAVLRNRMRELFYLQFTAREIIEVESLGFPTRSGKPMKERI